MAPQFVTWIALLLILLGMIALVTEVFLLPGFGVAGILGIILFAWGIILMAVDVTQATMALFWGLIATIVFFFLSLRLFKKFNIWERLTLSTKQHNKEGYTAPRAELELNIGKTGVSLTPLRPAGSVDISGHRLDVVTEGEFIPAGVPVEVVLVEGSRVVVRSISKTNN
ncbi:MAG: NfeD family protein [Desulfocucumaceae bacterium]